MDVAAGFPARLRSAREKAGLTQTDVASALGIAPQSVQKWESGETEPRPKRVDALAKILRVSPVELRYGSRPAKGDSVARLFDQPDPFAATLLSLSQADAKLRALTREVRGRRRDAIESSIDVLQDHFHEAGFHTDITESAASARIDLPDEFCSIYLSSPEFLSTPRGPITFDRERFLDVDPDHVPDRTAVAVPLLTLGARPEARWLMVSCKLLSVLPIDAVPNHPAQPSERRYRRVRYTFDDSELRVYLTGDGVRPSGGAEITQMLDEFHPDKLFDLPAGLSATG